MADAGIKDKCEVNPPQSVCHSPKQKGILLSATKPLSLASPPATSIKRFANPAELLFSEVKSDQQSEQSSQVQVPATAATCIATEPASSFPVCTIPVMSSQSGIEPVVCTSVVPALITQPALSLPSSGPVHVFQVPGTSPYLVKDVHLVNDSTPSHLTNFIPNQANLDCDPLRDDDSVEKRPQYSYSALIAMAILSSPKKTLTLPGIYDFISWRFPFYKTCNKDWKNSVRHTLSLNKCFVKSTTVPEGATQGKGNYWIIDPLCDNILENGTFRSPSKTRRSRRQGRNSLSEGTMPADVNIHESGCRNVTVSDPSPSSCETVEITAAMEQHDASSGVKVKATEAYKPASNFGVERLLS